MKFFLGYSFSLFQDVLFNFVYQAEDHLVLNQGQAETKVSAKQSSSVDND